MKRAFVMTSGCGLASSLVPEDTHNVLKIGSRITATRAIDLGVTLIGIGEQGTVDYIDPQTGMVEVLMDLVHRGLAYWDNHMWLEPFGTDDIIDGIACFSCVTAMALKFA